MLAWSVAPWCLSLSLLASCSSAGRDDASAPEPAQDGSAAKPDGAEPKGETAEPKPTPTPAAKPTPEPIASPDLAKHDLLEVPNFTGTDTSLLGLKLGLTWDEAKAIVDAHPDLVFHPDAPNPGRFYVDDARAGDGDPALFYLQWPDGRPTMGRMVIYERAKRFMPPGAARLFEMPTLADAPADVKAWLGQPDRSVVTLDIPSIGLQLTTHVFERRALEVIDYRSSDQPPHVIVALVVPELLARAEP